MDNPVFALSSDERAARMEQLEAILTRAAEEVGDLTEPAITRFYADSPAALEDFRHHAHGKLAQLQATMVETTLYCIMTWFERPGEIATILYGTVPHHTQTLHVVLPHFVGLLNAVIDAIADTIPAEEPAERALIEEIRNSLAVMIEDASKEWVPAPAQAVA